MIGRAGSGAEGADFFVQKLHQALFVQKRFGFLIEERLVGGTTALGDEQKLIGIAFIGIKVDLGRQVVAGVFFIKQIKRGYLAVAEIGFQLRLHHAF